MTSVPLRIAHRGMPRLARENTLTAFSLALEAGADAIELDVHCSADGIPVVHHDAVLSDGTPIASLSAEQIATRTADPANGVPTLAETCRLVGHRAVLFVEIKARGIEAEVLGVLDDFEGDAAVHSFDHDLVARVHAIDPTRRVGVLLDEGTTWSPADVITLMRRTEALDVWPHHSLVTEELVQAVHSANGRVLAWTVNDRALADRLVRDGVDGLCGDDVRVLPH